MTEASTNASELRRADRVRTIIGARAVFNGGRSSIDCQIRNISATGAKLMLSEGLSLPGHFDLDIPSRNKVHHVALRWRTKNAAGVEFLDAGAALAAGAPVDEGIEALRKENSVLRRKVVELQRRLAELGHSDWQR